MEDDPELVADADSVDDPGDLVAFVRRVTRESNVKIDRIKAEHDNTLEAVSRRIQSQLKKQEEQITQLSAKVDQGQAHTERVRQQVIQEGHKNDGRYAEINKKYGGDDGVSASGARRHAGAAEGVRQLGDEEDDEPMARAR